MQMLFLVFFYYLHKESRCLRVAMAKVQSLISDVIYSLKNDDKGATNPSKIDCVSGRKSSTSFVLVHFNKLRISHTI